MLVVALAALDLGAIRSMIVWKSMWGVLLVLGALPMANALAVALPIGQHPPGDRPFLLGFVAFGAMALALYVATVSRFPREVTMLSIRPLTDLLVRTLGPDRPLALIAMQCAGGVVMLGLPQWSFALMGGILARRHRISIARRPDRTRAR
jgi:hypothetical protein